MTNATKTPEIIEITIMSGPYDGERHLLRTPRAPSVGYVLGRREDCDLSLPYDDWVSGRHARLFCTEGVWYVEDLDSTNKTYLGKQRDNGTFAGRERADGPQSIGDGQLIQLGRLWIRVKPIQDESS